MVGSFVMLLLAGKGIAEARLSLSPSSFLRGRATAFAPDAAKPLHKPKHNPYLLDFWVDNLRRINAIGSKIQSKTVKHWNGINGRVARELDKLIGREWDKLVSSVTKMFSREQHQGS